MPKSTPGSQPKPRHGAVRPLSPRRLKQQDLERRRDLLTSEGEYAYRALVLYRIRVARKVKKLTQADVAMVIARPQTMVSDIETGVRELNIQTLRAISVAIGRTVWELANDAEDEFEIAIYSRVRDRFIAAREAGHAAPPVWDAIRDALVNLRDQQLFVPELAQVPIPLPAPESP